MTFDRAVATLLYVEDQVLTQETVVLALQEAGYSVLVADTGKQAIEHLETHAGIIRGLVTDVNLGPGPDGWDVARRARELASRMAIVYVTGAAGREWLSRGVPHSVVIAKPFSPAQIVVAISQLLNTTDA